MSEQPQDDAPEVEVRHHEAEGTYGVYVGGVLQRTHAAKADAEALASEFRPGYVAPEQTDGDNVQSGDGAPLEGDTGGSPA